MHESTQQGNVVSVALDTASEGLALWKLQLSDEASRSEVRLACDGPIPIRPGDSLVCDGNNCYWTPRDSSAHNIPFYQIAS